MGVSESSVDTNLIQNIGARQFFESVNSVALEETENARQASRVTRVIYESLKNIPASAKEFGFVIQGSNIGPTFLDIFSPKIVFPPVLTKVSFRGSDLGSKHAEAIANMLIKMPALKQFDCSENSFGDRGVVILRSAVAHPHLIALQMEECGLTDAALETVNQLLLYNRRLETLRISPLSVPTGAIKRAEASIHANRKLVSIGISESLKAETSAVSERNGFIAELVDSIARSPFKPSFRAKRLTAYKSVKGREMLIGRAKQREKVRGTELFSKLQQVDARARTIETSEEAKRVDLLRSGAAEMVGRRQTMEDVSIILSSTPTPSSSMFGIFDGHGGREAAEYAAQNLPKRITEYLKKGDAPSEAYIAAFRAIHNEMKSWCIYVGCTACIVSIQDLILTVANIGDTRCVLCRNGKAKRLSRDHKPDLPEETAFIQSKGGFVRDSRVGGMLAISRAFGDGFLGDCINPTPNFIMEQITADDKFLIIACDGVWDVMSDQEACDIVLSEIDPLLAAKKLKDSAFEKESTDNISVIVVSFADLTAKHFS